MVFFPRYSCRSNVSAYDIHSKSNQHQQQQPMQCAEPSINKTAIFVVCGVIVSLLLVFLIVKTVRHVYKPLRPRIKKTFVVHKNVVPTPLTCRPTTEQCEITIENCCNMNICDTVRVVTSCIHEVLISIIINSSFSVFVLKTAVLRSKNSAIGS